MRSMTYSGAAWPVPGWAAGGRGGLASSKELLLAAVWEALLTITGVLEAPIGDWSMRSRDMHSMLGSILSFFVDVPTEVTLLGPLTMGTTCVLLVYVRYALGKGRWRSLFCVGFVSIVPFVKSRLLHLLLSEHMFACVSDQVLQPQFFTGESMIRVTRQVFSQGLAARRRLMVVEIG